MKALVRHEVKPASLGQAMIKAVKPSSYIPPLLFGLGVELDNLFASNTAQKIKFSMRLSSVNVTKSAVSCGFGHIY